MKLLIVLFAFVALAAATSEPSEATYKLLWSQFQRTHKKSYANTLESAKRYQTFKDNFAKVNYHNEHVAPHEGWTMGMNKFGDLTAAEFRARYLGTHSGIRQPANPFTIESATQPKAVDWRTKGVVTPVKNQGQCGSCWSFSTTGSIEGQHALKTGKLVSLSEQNLIDCSTKYGNQGCNGGLMDDAFKYVINNNGIDTEASYPYTTSGPNACEFKRSNVGATISSFHDIPSGSEQQLQAALASVGPVSVAVDASQMQFYSGGVFGPSSCSSTQLDHGVLAVGYGTTSSGQDYYIVKNSWGQDWGIQSGYLYMARNENNKCGIATQASYPQV